MSPFPTGTEVDGAIPYAGQFFDRGAAVRNVQHPDFGAKADAANDDGVAWNLARADLPAAGGTILVPSGAYLLTTAFTFSTNDDVLLVLMPGVVLTGLALPTPTLDNNIIDLRDGNILTEGALAVTGVITANADITIPGNSGVARINFGTNVGAFGAQMYRSTASVVILGVPGATSSESLSIVSSTGGNILDLLGDCELHPFPPNDYLLLP